LFLCSFRLGTYAPSVQNTCQENKMSRLCSTDNGARKTEDGLPTTTRSLQRNGDERRSCHCERSAAICLRTENGQLSLHPQITSISTDFPSTTDYGDVIAGAVICAPSSALRPPAPVVLFTPCHSSYRAACPPPPDTVPRSDRGPVCPEQSSVE